MVKHPRGGGWLRLGVQGLQALLASLWKPLGPGLRWEEAAKQTAGYRAWQFGPSLSSSRIQVLPYKE